LIELQKHQVSREKKKEKKKRKYIKSNNNQCNTTSFVVFISPAGMTCGKEKEKKNLFLSTTFISHTRSYL